MDFWLPQVHRDARIPTKGGSDAHIASGGPDFAGLG